MNAIQGAALAADTQPAPSGPPGGGIPSGSYGGGGWSGGGWSGGNWSGGHQPPRRSRRFRRGVAMGAAGVALTAAAAVRWSDATQPSGSTAGKATTSATTTLTRAQIAAKVSPGLVDINTTLGYSNEKAAGTGMVLTSTGEVLTNNHVIDGATSISVTDIGNGRTYQATVTGYDATKDIAVLQLQDASNLPTVTLGGSSSVSVGQRVVAIGNAEGKGGRPSAVSGTVTALGQSITASDAGSGNSEQLTGLIQSNAPIEPGDSGGPLVNSSGQVIGMDTAASSSSASPTAQGATPGQSGQSSGGSGATATQAFSIPISAAETVAAQIVAGTSSSTVHIGSTAFLGVEVSAAASSSGTGGYGGYGSGYGYGGYGYGGGTSGATVIGTVSGSPAATSGLAAGDVITSVAGRTVTTSPQVSSILATYHPGDQVSVSWTDAAGQSHTASISLATGPAA